MKYRINYHSYYDEKGNMVRSYYTISYQKKNFFGKIVWRDVRHSSSSFEYSFVTEFDKLDDVRNYVDEVLSGKHKSQNWETIILEEGQLSR